ncbi:MAG: chemotaxis protein MotB [Alphaproteobacteria bacterium]|nr:MAG: chemotaxis protein MotB [Alphaproteobacteria bacterium]
MARANDDERPLVIKKVKKGGGGGHHGGAWKVAYADFTTAMMAFFMLLWLLNVSDKETLEGLADYFSPTSASVSGPSGAGKPFAGTAMDDAGTMGAGAAVVKIQGPPPTADNRDETLGHASDSSTAESEEFSPRTPDAADRAMAALENELRQAIQNSPQLARHRDQILIEQTPEGVRIQITDKDRRPLFRADTAELYTFARRLLKEIGAIVSALPNRIAITGHTDSRDLHDLAGYSIWELSADRANAARRVLAASGVSSDRFAEVTGKADTEPLYPTAPDRPENRRISILVLREAPVVAPGAGRRR